MKKKNLFQRVWHFLWADESLISWIVLLVLCFLVIFFVFFPVSSAVFSSELPYVVIESGSMIHQGNFDEWWDFHGLWYENLSITKEDFKKFPYKNGLNIGDIIVVKGSNDYKVGDVIIFDANETKPIIHRIVFRKTKCNVTYDIRPAITETKEENCSLTMTKGDNNAGQLGVELNISNGQILGKAVFMIPKAGYVKLIPCYIFPEFCNFIDKIRR